jgi:hypothetical protein
MNSTAKEDNPLIEEEIKGKKSRSLTLTIHKSL